jgi:hypothetical protein
VSAARKILKVVRDPHLTAAILNAQVRMRRKATVPLLYVSTAAFIFGPAVM